MSRDTEMLRAVARRRRREGEHVRAIANALGIPRSTIGDWVSDLEVEVYRTCALCGDSFTDGLQSGGSSRHYCCRQHQWKANKMRTAA